MSENSNEFEKVETADSPSVNDSTEKSSPSEGQSVENLLEGDAEKFEQIKTESESFNIDWGASGKTDSGLKSENTASGNAKKEAISKLLNADVILWGADTILSRVGVFLSNMTGTKSTKDDWCLDAKEKAEIKPILEATIKEENWTHIPAKYILVGVVLVIYATKIQIVSEREKTKKEAEHKLKDETLSNDLEKAKERVRNNVVDEDENFEKVAEVDSERKRVLIEIRKRLISDKKFIFDKKKLPFDITQNELDFLLEGISGYTKYGTKIGRPKVNADGSEDADFVLVK